MVAALLHDIERFMPGFKVPGIKDSRLDAVRKRAIHPLNSARIADILLEGSGLSYRERRKVRYLIEHHDAGGDKICLGGKVLVSGGVSGGEYYDDVATLTNADSMAFFKRTIRPFIEDRLSKNESMEKILSRIAMLYDRIKSPDIRNKVNDIMEKVWEHRDPQVFEVFTEASGRVRALPAGVAPGSREQDYTGFLKANAGLISAYLSDSREDILLRVPVEILSSMPSEEIKDFFDVFQNKNSNGYIELFHASGDARASDISRSSYGVRGKPDGFNCGKGNTITLMPVFKGEISADERQARRDIEQLVRTRIGVIEHNETQVVPVGYHNDPASFLRGTVLGMVMMHIAREKNEGKKSIEILAQDRSANTVLDFYGPGDIKRVGLTVNDIVALATGDINKIVPALKKLIELLPIEPVDARRIYENSRKLWISA